MYTCHDVMFGAFCIYECVYCKGNNNLVCHTAIKKVFLDTYNNRCLAFVVFRGRNKTIQDEWVFPPLCVQDNSYSYVLAVLVQMDCAGFVAV